MAFHVFIERTLDPSPAAIRRVAGAIAERYGLPAATIEQRLTSGRFRVKKNVDRDTALRFAETIHQLGAVCTIVDADSGAPLAQPGAAAPAASQPSGRMRPPAIPAAPARPRAPGARPPAAAAGAAPPSSASSTGDYESGLAAAFSSSSSQANLGALDTGSFNLATLDGDDDDSMRAPSVAAEVESYAPPDEDMFAPPSAGETPLELALDTPVPPSVPRGLAAPAPSELSSGDFEPIDVAQQALAEAEAAVARHTPPAMPAMPAMPIAGADAAPPPKPPRPNPLVVAREQIVNNPRVRLAAGVALAILIGFLPARIFWSMRVGEAQAKLNVAMEGHYDEAKADVDKWERLEEVTRAQRSVAESTLFNNRITAILIWAACGGLLAFVWFRKIRWEDL